MTNSIKGAIVFSSGHLSTVITDHNEYFYIKEEILLFLHLIIVDIQNCEQSLNLISSFCQIWVDHKTSPENLK